MIIDLWPKRFQTRVHYGSLSIALPLHTCSIKPQLWSSSISKLPLQLRKASPKKATYIVCSITFTNRSIKFPRIKTLPFDWNMQISSSNILNLSVHIWFTLPWVGTGLFALDLNSIHINFTPQSLRTKLDLNLINPLRFCPHYELNLW